VVAGDDAIPVPGTGGLIGAFFGASDMVCFNGGFTQKEEENRLYRNLDT
jgi:hypothetical protein